MGKKSGQIPAFGDWENANEMPITQYFESARQAGLFPRYHVSSSSSATLPSHHHHHHLHLHQYCDSSCIAPRGGGGGGYGYGCNDRLYDADFQNPSSVRVLPVPHHTKAGHHNGRVSKSKCNSEEHSNRRRGSCGCPVHMEEHRHRRTTILMSSHHQKYYQNKGPFAKTSSSSAINIADLNRPRPTATTTIPTNAKPVDEDLYKIPPEQLHHHSISKRKKMLRFFSKCLVPPCGA